MMDIVAVMCRVPITDGQLNLGTWQVHYNFCLPFRDCTNSWCSLHCFCMHKSESCKCNEVQEVHSLQNPFCFLPED